MYKGPKEDSFPNSAYINKISDSLWKYMNWFREVDDNQRSTVSNNAKHIVLERQFRRNSNRQSGSKKTG